jgi:FKBP-type peptidyl-prolyl cis-trans isomerase FklB
MSLRAFLLPLALGLIACAPAFAQQPGAAPAADALSTPKAQASYAVGHNIGSSMREEGVTIDESAFMRGVRDALANAKPALSEEQLDAALRQLQIDLATQRAERTAALAKTNAEAGEAFLKANAAKPGVVTLPSGLQYQVITAGAGPKPTASSTVRARYRGTLLDGTEFDSSGQEAASFPVGQVIPGWTEALQLMPVGSKWRLFLPSNLAYGARGAGQEIGPNATLIFDVELLGIE